MKRLFLISLSSLILFSCGSLRPNRPLGKSSKKPAFEHEILSDEESPTQTQEPKQLEKPESSSSYSESSSDKMDAFIDDWYGTPHRMGGMTKKGVDCSGFVIIAYREVLGKEFKGRRAEDLFGEMQALSIDDLEYGDLVFFKIRGRRIDHVGIYLDDLKFVHTSSSRGVMVSSLTNVYWQKRFFKGGRHRD